MDETTVRKALDGLRDELARFDDERNVYVNLIRNYETWLRLRGKDVSSPSPLPIPTGPSESRAGAPPPPSPERSNEDGPSFRGSVLQVLRDAHGEPLHAKEILRRVEAVGAHSDAKNKLSVVSLSIRGLSERHPIEKTGPRMWRWAGPPAEEP